MRSVALAVHDGIMIFEVASVCEVFGVDRGPADPWYLSVPTTTIAIDVASRRPLGQQSGDQRPEAETGTHPDGDPAGTTARALG